MSWQSTSLVFSEIEERKILSVEVLGEKIVLIRDANQIYALEDRCSHDNAQFDGGQIIEENLECPRHGAWFDFKTGAVTGMPAVVGIKTFPTQVREGVVFVDV